jgi:hypothetical protein
MFSNIFVPNPVGDPHPARHENTGTSTAAVVAQGIRRAICYLRVAMYSDLPISLQGERAAIVDLLRHPWTVGSGETPAQF